ncbi:MAG: DUF3256 family protein [Clostridiales bacterium]|nr:DUF3256 family protein [Clostridiales bacterium]
MSRSLSIIAAIAAVTLTAAMHAITPRQAFTTAPREVIMTIDSITRLDMLDYYGSSANAASRNAFNSEVSVRFMNDDLITVATSKSSEVTIIPLAAGKDTLLMVINTLALPASDSKATIYNSSWTRSGDARQLPDHNNLSMWLMPQAEEKISEIENLIPFVPATYTYNDGVLTMTNTLGRLIPKDEYSRIKQYIIPSISYRWTGKKWKQEKPYTHR